MASTSIKSTYSLDVETVRALEEMARRWKVSKSEALRRAIRGAAEGDDPGAASRLRALDRLQDSLALRAADLRRWERETAAERRAAARLATANHDDFRRFADAGLVLAES